MCLCVFVSVFLYLEELLDPTYVRALQRRADAYLSMGDWSSAVKDLEALAPHMGAECTAKLMEARRKVKKVGQRERERGEREGGEREKEREEKEERRAIL